MALSGICCSICGQALLESDKFCCGMPTLAHLSNVSKNLENNAKDLKKIIERMEEIEEDIKALKRVLDM